MRGALRVVLAVLSVIAVGPTWTEAQTPTGSAVSVFDPREYTPNQSLTVSIEVTISGDAAEWRVEDRPPSDWYVSSITGNGSFDHASGLVKWGPIYGFGSQTVTYKVIPPQNEDGVKTFVGTAYFDNQRTNVIGDRSIGKSSGQPPSNQIYWVEVAANIEGGGDSRWLTDLSAVNSGTPTASVELVLHQDDGDTTLTTSVNGDSQVVWEDVVSLMGAQGMGSLEVRSDQPLRVTSRMYSSSSDGTFGQFFDAYTADQGLDTGEMAWLQQLRQKEGEFRTNLQLTNIGTLEGSVLVRLFSDDGFLLHSYTVPLSPGQLVQDNEPFKTRAGQPDLGWGYATVEAVAGIGILASASVVDARTSDATTVPMKR